MPANSHLTFFDIDDFTPGLYTEPSALKQFSMPDGAAQQMDDCLALKTGGIRAFFKGTQLSSSGIVAPTTESVSGIGQRTGIPLRSGAAGDAVDRFMMTFSSADKKQRLYRMDGTGGLTVWSQKDSTYTMAASSVNSVRSTQFVPFFDVNGATWMLVVVRSAGGIGLWKVAYVGGALPVTADGLFTQISSTPSGPLAVNQARIIIGDGGATKPYRLYYGDVGLVTGAIAALTSFVDVAPYIDGNGLAIVAPQEPSNLLIGKEGAPWTIIQGDISATTTPITDMGAVHTPGFTEQQVIRTPDGVAYVEPDGRIYLTDGRTFQSISDQIDRFAKIDSTLTDHVNLGQMAFLGDWLWAPQGYVRDWTTGAWHRVTAMANASHWLANAYNQKVWGSNGGGSPTFWEYQPFDKTGFNAEQQRMNTYTWRSAPLADKTARDARIREFHIFYDASTASNFTVTRTDSKGQAVVRGRAIAAGRGVVTIGFPNYGTGYQDMKIVASATNSALEAPIIERVRVGFVPGRLGKV